MDDVGYVVLESGYGAHHPNYLLQKNSRIIVLVHSYVAWLDRIREGEVGCELKDAFSWGEKSQTAAVATWTPAINRVKRNLTNIIMHGGIKLRDVAVCRKKESKKN